jgi:uncharacterized membrane-anchored protein
MAHQVTTRRAEAQMLSKVPEVSALFWITKVLTTGMGETASDFLVHRFAPELAVVVAGLVLAVALAVQFTTRRYQAWTYWSAVIMVSVFGTMAADVMHIGLGVSYFASTVLFAVVLAAVFVAWYATEHTLSIHSITTRRRECFYWLTVLTTFALGTATGDLTAATMHFGYLVSGFVFAALIAVPALAYWRFREHPILAFWFAYVLTRPLGASFADWAGVSHARGGLAIGTGTVTLALSVAIVALVGWLSWARSGPTEERAV